MFQRQSNRFIYKIIFNQRLLKYKEKFKRKVDMYMDIHEQFAFEI